MPVSLCAAVSPELVGWRCLWGGPLCRRPGLCPPKRVNVSEDAVGGKQPEVPGPRTPLYPRAHRTRDTIDAHSRSAAGVGNSPRHTTDPSPQRKGRPLPPPGQSGSRFPPNTPWSLSPFEGVPGGNTPQTVFGPLTNTTQKPTNRFTAREGPLMTPTPHGHQFAQHPHTLPTYSSEPFLNRTGFSGDSIGWEIMESWED